MTITVYTPSLQVTLIKLVQRKEGAASIYTGSNRTIDMTPYLGDAGAVRTVKGLGEPAGGFSISFADRMDPVLQDSLYAAIEPMDMVEIRASRTPKDYAGGTLPLIMRGFVSLVRRVEGVGPDGTPQRVVVVQGQDFGKLWMIHGAWPELAIATEQPMLTLYGLQAAIGMDVRAMTASEFIATLTEKVLNKKIADLSAVAQRQVKPFVVETSVPDGMIYPSQESVMRAGPFWGLVEQFADRPWNEAFIRDEEDGPHLVFRPAPYKDVDGKLILNGAADPGAVALDISAVVSLDMARSDARVANFFNVTSEVGQLNSGLQVNVANLIRGDVFEQDHGNNRPALFGEKRLDVETRLQPNDVNVPPAMLPLNERPAKAGTVIDWVAARRAQLRAINHDNSVFEEGGATVQGSENLAIGKYLRLTRGDLVSESYITRVSHTFAPMQTWVTTIGLERGTGFLVRNQYEGSPYISEGFKGPYSK